MFEGRRIIDNDHPALVITDMMMPKMGGFPVLEHIRSQPSPPRVIMITANEGGRHKAYAEMLGVDEYLRKPFAMDVLLEAVERIIGSGEEGGPGSQNSGPQNSGPSRLKRHSDQALPAISRLPPRPRPTIFLRESGRKKGSLHAQAPLDLLRPRRDEDVTHRVVVLNRGLVGSGIFAHVVPALLVVLGRSHPPAAR